MSASDNYVPVTDAGNGTTTAFSFDWTILNEDYLVVKLRDDVTGVDTLQEIGTDYTVSFDETGGTCTFTTAPASGKTVILERSIPVTQGTPYRTSKGFNGDTVEDSFDKLTLIAQDQREQSNRTAKVPVGVVADVTLPTPVANQVPYWIDSSGAMGNLNVNTPSYQGTWSSSTTYAVSDIVIYNGNSYLSLSANTNKQPDVSTSDWAALAVVNTGLAPASNLSDVDDAETSFDNISPTTTEGDIIYNDGTNNVRLPIGSAGQVLAVNSSGTSIEYRSGISTAWVNFDGTGTVAIRDSFNVSSITDNGIGNYTVNFASSLSNADYALAGNIASNTNGASGIRGFNANDKTTSSFDIYCFRTDSGSIPLDCPVVDMIVVGGN